MKQRDLSRIASRERLSCAFGWLAVALALLVIGPSAAARANAPGDEPGPGGSVAAEPRPSPLERHPLAFTFLLGFAFSATLTGARKLWELKMAAKGAGR